MLPLWNPTQLGCIQRDGFSVHPLPRTAVTRAEISPLRAVRADTRAPIAADLQVSQSDAQYRAFVQWVAVDLAGGARAFAADLYLYGVVRRVRMRLMGPWQAQRESFDAWVMAVPVEIEREPLPAPAPPPVAEPVVLANHIVRATGQAGSGDQQPEVYVSLSGDSYQAEDVFGLGRLGFQRGSGQQLHVDGVAYPAQQYEVPDEWWIGADPAPVAEYEAQLTVVSGIAPIFGPAPGTWVALTGVQFAGPLWGVFAMLLSSSDFYQGQWLIEIRDSASATVRAAAIMSITLDYEPIPP